MISASVHDTYHAKICLASEKSIFAKLRLIGSTNKYKHVTKYLDFANQILDYALSYFVFVRKDICSDFLYSGWYCICYSIIDFKKRLLALR